MIVRVPVKNHGWLFLGYVAGRQEDGDYGKRTQSLRGLVADSTCQKQAPRTDPGGV